MSCDFEATNLEFLLRDIFIVNYDKGSVQDRLLEEKKTSTLKQVLEIAITKSSVQTGNYRFVQRFKLNKNRESIFLEQNRKPRCMAHVQPKGKKSFRRSSARATETERCKVCGRKKCAYRECFCLAAKKGI